MASNLGFEIPPAGKWKDLRILEDGEEVVPEPTGTDAERKIWTTQLMIPFSIKKDNYAFCGPYPSHFETISKEVNAIFPLHVTCGSRVFESDPYNFGYLKNSLKLFTAAPYTTHKEYIPWLDRVENVTARPSAFPALLPHDLLQPPSLLEFLPSVGIEPMYLGISTCPIHSHYQLG